VLEYEAQGNLSLPTAISQMATAPSEESNCGFPAISLVAEPAVVFRRNDELVPGGGFL
jgi:hypothetical protein